MADFENQNDIFCKYVKKIEFLRKIFLESAIRFDGLYLY